MAHPGFTNRPARKSYDVIIVGGAMYGSAVAWFLTDNPDFDGSILVIEKAPSYSMCSTAHTNSCIRQQFSQKINIEISQFGVAFIKSFRERLGGDKRVPDIALQSFGYLYLAQTQAFADMLRSVQSLQAECGAGTKFLTKDDIATQYPFYNLNGIVGGNHNLIDEGYFDGATMFDWWKRSAKERGVEYLHSEVVGLIKDGKGQKITSVKLASGEEVVCGVLVNASGPRAAVTAGMAGISIPVEPRKRYTFIFDAENPLDRDLPLTIDPSGVHMRTDGQYYLAGCPPDDDPAVDFDDFEEDHSIWQEKAWPAIANRIPQFEAIKLTNSWVGHYAYNTLDQNAIIGPHSEIENFIFVNGFSGHGFQQSPALARGTAEWISYGEYRTLDLSPLSFERIAKGDPFVEEAVI